MTTRPDCATMEEWISESLDSPLPEDRRAMLAGHLQECASCAAFQVDLEAMSLELRPAPRADLRRVWSRLAPALPRPAARFRGWQVAAAFLLAVLAYAAGRLSPSPAPAPVARLSPPPAAAPAASEPRVLSDISARVTVAALFPGAGDPGAVLVEETKGLAAPELFRSPR